LTGPAARFILPDMDRPSPHVHVVADPAAVAQAGARLWVDSVRHALAARGAFHVALAGGATPRDLHKAVSAQADLDFAWHRTHVYWSDERAVPPTDEQSNYGMADESLLCAVPLSPAQIHRMPADADDLEAAARAYAATLAHELAPADHAPPALDRGSGWGGRAHRVPVSGSPPCACATAGSPR
jgi:6-phosphogluconolactonase